MIQMTMNAALTTLCVRTMPPELSFVPAQFGDADKVVALFGTLIAGYAPGIVPNPFDQFLKEGCEGCPRKVYLPFPVG